MNVQLALIDAGADDHVLDLNGWLGEIDFDPELRPIADLRRPFAQADAALGAQRDAVDAFAFDVEADRALLGIFEALRVLVPAPAIGRIPQLNFGNA